MAQLDVESLEILLRDLAKNLPRVKTSLEKAVKLLSHVQPGQGRLQVIHGAWRGRWDLSW